MKKIYVISICITIVLVVTIGILFIIKRHQNELKVTVIPKDYHHLFLSNEEMAFDVEILVNSKDSSLTNKELINKVYIKDQDQMYQLQLLQIKDLEKTLKIKSDIFHKYIFHFILIGEINNEAINLNKTFLSIETSKMTFDLYIGNVSFLKVLNFGSPNNELAINYLKGVTVEENFRKKLCAIIIGFRNNSSSTITVNNVEIICENISFSNSEKIELAEPKIDNLTINYDLYTNYDNSKIYFNLNANEVKYFLLPIKYLQPKYLSQCGFKIEYEKEGVSHVMYFDDFLFFTEQSLSHQLLNNLVIYLYGNH